MVAGGLVTLLVKYNTMVSSYVWKKNKGWCKIQSKAAFEQLNAKNQKNLNSKTSEANIQYATFTHIQHSKAMALNSFFSTFMAILLYA